MLVILTIITLAIISIGCLKPIMAIVGMITFELKSKLLAKFMRRFVALIRFLMDHS